MWVFLFFLFGKKEKKENKKGNDVPLPLNQNKTLEDFQSLTLRESEPV